MLCTVSLSPPPATDLLGSHHDSLSQSLLHMAQDHQLCRSQNYSAREGGELEDRGTGTLGLTCCGQIRVHVYVFMYTCIHVYINVPVQYNVHACTCTCTCTCVVELTIFTMYLENTKYTCMYMYMYMYMYIHLLVPVYIHVHAKSHLRVQCTCTCMYINHQVPRVVLYQLQLTSLPSPT